MIFDIGRRHTRTRKHIIPRCVVPPGTVKTAPLVAHVARVVVRVKVILAIVATAVLLEVMGERSGRVVNGGRGEMMVMMMVRGGRHNDAAAVYNAAVKRRCCGL